jgi:hypothetical protein
MCNMFHMPVCAIGKSGTPEQQVQGVSDAPVPDDKMRHVHARSARWTRWSDGSGSKDESGASDASSASGQCACPMTVFQS